ncbi:MbeD family mobilization/exclusion protein, partial [Klebsiella pneumoniae]|nr:MbeD family mobilization/exclusion protein [Klebsiella pneumoniae]
MRDLEILLLTVLEQLHQVYLHRLVVWESSFAEWQKMSGLMQRENAALNESVTRLSIEVRTLDGRVNEITALHQDIERIADGGSSAIPRRRSPTRPAFASSPDVAALMR